MRTKGPERFVECRECGGEGSIETTIHVYEAGCGFSHPDVYAAPCLRCNGSGGTIEESPADPSPPLVEKHECF